MITWLESEYLRSKGVNDDDIALINQELPDIDNLITVIEAHVAQMNRVLKLLPILQKIIASERATT